MLIIRGVNVYPRTIETVLMEDPDVGANYAIVIDRRPTLPELMARVELAHDGLSGSETAIADRITTKLTETVRLRVKVIVGAAGSVPRSELGKAKRVFEQTDDNDPLAT